MKKLTVTLLVAVCSLSANAQKFEIGVNGGLVKNSIPSDAMEVPMENPVRGLVNPTGSIKGILNLHHWQLGLSAGAMRMSYQVHSVSYFVRANDDLRGIIDRLYPIFPPPPRVYKVILANPALDFRLFLNRTVNIKRFQLAGGIAVGYLYLINNKQYSDNVTYRDNTGGMGISAGVQVSATYYVTKHIGINTEVVADHILLGVLPENNAKTVTVVSGTAGIRYRF